MISHTRVAVHTDTYKEERFLYKGPILSQHTQVVDCKSKRKSKEVHQISDVAKSGQINWVIASFPIATSHMS